MGELQEKNPKPERINSIADKVAIEAINNGGYSETFLNLKQGEREKILDEIIAGNHSNEEAVLIFIATSLQFARPHLKEELAYRILKIPGSKAEQSVLSNLDKFPDLDREDFIKEIIKNDKAYLIPKYIDSFKGIDHSKIVLALIEAGEYGFFIDKIKRFRGLSQEAAEKLIEEDPRNNIVHILNNLEHFENPDHNYLAGIAIENERFVELARRLSGLKGLEKDIAIELIDPPRSPDGTTVGSQVGSVIAHINSFDGLDEEVAVKILNKINQFSSGDDVGTIASHINRFEGLTQEWLAEKLIKLDLTRLLILEFQKFTDLDPKEYGERFIKSGYGVLVLQFLEKFPGVDHKRLAIKLADEGNGNSLVISIDRLEGVDHDELIERMLSRNESYTLISLAQQPEKIKNFRRDLALKVLQQILTGPMKALSMQEIAKFSNYFKPPLDRLTSKTVEIFGDFAIWENYNAVKLISEGVVVPEEAKVLGVKYAGERGLLELTQILRKLNKEVIEDTIDPEILLSSSMARNYVKSLARYSSSEWGEHDDESFIQIIRRYKKHRTAEDEFIGPLQPEYKPADIEIDKIDAEEQKKFKYSEGFVKRYVTLLKSIENAQDIAKDKKPLSGIINMVKYKIEEVKKNIQEKLKKSTHPKAQEALKNSLEKLYSLNLRSLKDFQSNFEFLASLKEFDEELRILTFVMAFRKHPEFIGANILEHQTDRQKPSIESISWVLNFVDHISNRETMSRYFTDKKAAKTFNELINVRSLSEELARAQNQDRKGKMNMKLVPNRGLLMELSGHIADACWASKYESMAEELPNFTSVIMVQNPNTAHERLAGAFMLIESNSRDGEPLLIIRGLNPQQNVINQLSAEDFTDQIVSYCQGIAKEKNRKLAIVIDDHVSGSSTNRPTLYSHLSTLTHKLTRVKLKSEADTTFNDYDITNDTYLIAA
jgi:hypothetical protein